MTEPEVKPAPETAQQISARHAAEMKALLDEHHERRLELIGGDEPTLDEQAAAHVHAIGVSAAIAAMCERHRREANPPPPPPVKAAEESAEAAEAE